MAAGLLAYCSLSGGQPYPLGGVLNLLIAPMAPFLLLILPLITILLYKLIPRRYGKISLVLTIIGLFITGSFALPFLTTPISLTETNQAFTDTFGAGWNDLDPDLQGSFNDYPFTLADTWVEGSEPKTDSWKKQADITFKKTADFELKYDVYYPGPEAETDIGKHATIIFIHGGGWIIGTKTRGADRLKHYASQGYVCFTIDYRLLDMSIFDLAKSASGISLDMLSSFSVAPDANYVGNFSIADMMKDVADFTQHLADNDGTDALYGADLDHVFLMGLSAGSLLAGLAGFGYNDDLIEKNWGLNPRLSLDGMVLFYTPNDARYFFYEGTRCYYEKGMTEGYTPENNPDYYDLYTPSMHVDSEDPPCLLLHGTSDSMVPIKNSLEIQEACKSQGVDCVLMKHYFVGHAMDMADFHGSMCQYYVERFMYAVNS